MNKPKVIIEPNYDVTSAPIEYTSEEASAYLAGYNAAIEQLLKPISAVRGKSGAAALELSLRGKPLTVPQVVAFLLTANSESQVLLPGFPRGNYPLTKIKLGCYGPMDRMDSATVEFT